MNRLVKMSFIGGLVFLFFSVKEAAAVNITMWQVDTQHTGQNLYEMQLTPDIISAPGNFGYLFSQPLDGQSYGQPLLVSGVKIDNSVHNVVYVATEHDSIYAFDADSKLGNSAKPLWQVSLLPEGARPVPQSMVGSSDISIEVGVTTTPVIDAPSNTIYVISKIQVLQNSTYQQYLHALDLATGSEKFGGPVLINPTFAGSADDGKKGIIPFNPLRQNSRAAMTLYHGVVYLTFASHSDNGPYHGEILGYDAITLKLRSTFISTPNGEAPCGGIWQGGASPAIDSFGNMYVAVANGLWDQTASQYTKGTNWGESMLKLPTNISGPIHVSFEDTLSWFTPNSWNNLNKRDLDLGSSGLLLLPDQVNGPHRHIMVGGSKGGILYVVDRDNMGGIHTPDSVVQEIREINNDFLFVTPAYFNGHIYYSAAGGPLEQRAVGYDASTGNYIAATPIISSANYGGKGSGVFISANGSTNGIAWLLNGTGFDAYDAKNVSGPPIFSGSAIAPLNINCQTPKFGLPIVANGKVYFTAFDNTNTGHLFVFGLLSSVSVPSTPDHPVARPISSSRMSVTWADSTENAVGFTVKRSISSLGPFQTVGTTGAHVTSYTDRNLRPETSYFYQVLAFNSKGSSEPTSTVTASTFPFFALPGLVAYWNFDEGNPDTVVDVTGNGHVGKVEGETVPAAGIVNGAYIFHGAGVATSRISVVDSEDLRFTSKQSFTLSAWINPANLHGSEQAVIAKSVDQGAAYGIWINARNQWVFRGPDGDLVGPTAIQGEWVHVAVVQDGVAGTREIYINGTSAGNQGKAQAADGSGALWMGQQNKTDNPESFPGLIDEVRLYQRALTAGEIKTLLGPPILEAVSLQSSKDSDISKIRLFPSLETVTDTQSGSPTGSYQLVLSFSAPVSHLKAALSLQGEGAVAGGVDTLSYDRTQKVVTVMIKDVGNDQALILHLSGIQPGNGTADIPFAVKWKTK